MELTLNLVWVCLSGAVLWRWTRSEKPGASSHWFGLLALGCVLLLLFPAVSISDDLQVNSATLEDASVRKWTPGQPHFAPAVATAPSVPELPGVTIAFFAAPSPSVSLPDASLRSPRAPPLA
jgi:hypothetical protein